MRTISLEQGKKLENAWNYSLYYVRSMPLNAKNNPMEACVVISFVLENYPPHISTLELLIVVLSEVVSQFLAVVAQSPLKRWMTCLNRPGKYAEFLKLTPALQGWLTISIHQISILLCFNPRFDISAESSPFLTLMLFWNLKVMCVIVERRWFQPQNHGWSHM